MKIIHLIFSLTTGGAEAMLVDIINEQIKTEEVGLVIINNKVNKDILSQLNDHVHVYKMNRNPGSRNPFLILRLNGLLLKLGPHIIHCHDCKAIETLLFSSIKKKAVLTIHDTKIIYPKFGRYKKLFAISNAVKQDVDIRYNIDTTLVYNGIKIENIIQKINQRANVYKIIQISRLVHEKKGQDILIKAIKEIVEKYNQKNILIDFIGEGPSFDYLKQLVMKLELKQYIHFLGQKDREYIYTHLCEYDLLVQPSLNEGFGLTIAEAMAAKVPVLVSDIEGPMEVIKNGEFGYCFKIGEVNSLATKIMDIMENRNIELTEKAYQHVNTHFSIQQTAKNYIEQYSTTNLNN